MEPTTIASDRTDAGATRTIFDSRILAWVILFIGFAALTRLALKGWIPHDEGTLGQAASRVMRGDVPHVDFHDTYGGLQAFVHAGLFEAIGESVRSLRIANVAIAGIAGCASYALVRRVQPVGVAAATCVATWLLGFSVYPASVPSWWNVAFGLVAAHYFVRWLETRNEIHLVVAGVVTGFSFLVKSTALYVAAAIALYLIMMWRRTSRRATPLVAVGWAIALGFGALVLTSRSFQSFALLVLPLWTIVFVGYRSTKSQDVGDAVVTGRALTMYTVAAMTPVLIFVLPYLWSGNGESLVTGWLRLPAMRFERASFGFAVSPSYVLMLLAIGLLVYVVKRRMGARVALGTMVGLALVLSVFAWHEFWQLVVSMLVLGPVVVAGGVVWEHRRETLTTDRLFLALALATFAFIQIPESNSIYALYLFPWIVIVVAMWAAKPNSARALAVMLLVLSSIVFVQLTRNVLYLSIPLAQPVEMAPLDVDRGQISIPRQQGFYTDMVEHLAKYEGSIIYAGPDSPEIYFLTGAINPTPVLFEFLTDEWGIDDLEALVYERRPSAIVVSRSPDFSDRLPETLLRAIEGRYPRRVSFGWFDVYESP